MSKAAFEKIIAGLNEALSIVRSECEPQPHPSYTEWYPPIPEFELKNCHGYEVNRVVVTEGGEIYAKSNSGWFQIKASGERH